MKQVKLKQIIDAISNKEIISVTELEEVTKIPRTSLLRYLNDLSKSGKITKTFGEVQIRKSAHETNPFPRLNTHKSIKEKIAQKAVKLIKNGDVIFIDGGSTTYYFAQALKNMEITIYTNNLLFSKLLNENYKPVVNVIPGEVNKTTLVSASSSSVQFINNILFDKVFIGFNSFDGKNLATTNEKESQLKRTLVLNGNSKSVFALGRKGKQVEKAKFIFANKSEITIISEDN